MILKALQAKLFRIHNDSLGLKILKFPEFNLRIPLIIRGSLSSNNFFEKFWATKIQGMNATNVKHIQLVQHFILSTPRPNLITPNLILILES